MTSAYSVHVSIHGIEVRAPILERIAGGMVHHYCHLELTASNQKKKRKKNKNAKWIILQECGVGGRLSLAGSRQLYSSRGSAHGKTL